MTDRMEYSTFNLRDEHGDRAPDQNMICVRLWADGNWVDAVFDKDLALEHAAKMIEMANLL